MPGNAGEWVMEARWCMDTQGNQLYQCVSALAMLL